MASAHTASKIKPAHLLLLAVIYIRQSTIFQVLHNTASAARQYDMYQLALDLGWAKENIVAVDQDQAISGTTIAGRRGFQQILDDIYAGRVGALFCLESSRLSRDGGDFLQLVKACAESGTLIVDENGIHDPNNDNDHLLLSIMGVIAEAEHRALRAKLQKGKLKKAEMGKLRIRLPIGLVRDYTGQVVHHPDEQVRNALRLLFDLFEQLGSALAVVKHFAANGLLFPTHGRSGDPTKIDWGPLSHNRAMELLHNPAYAGAYVWGRTEPRTRKNDRGRLERVPKGHVKREEWLVLKHDIYPPYISWETFLRNRQRLADNLTNSPKRSRGAVRDGAALLQGITRCGVCSRRMHVHYVGGGQRPYYRCSYETSKFGGHLCQGIPGTALDMKVSDLLLQAISPAQLEISMNALKQVESQASEIERQRNRQIERAKYEADKAETRFMEVDPTNRLVARTLEDQWEAALLEVKRLRRELERRPGRALSILTDERRRSIEALSKDLPTIWQADTTSNKQRKQLLQLLIREATLTREGETVRVEILWNTGTSTGHVVRLQRLNNYNRTGPDVVAKVRELAAGHTDQQIADQLNAAGVTTKYGKRFSYNRVRSLRFTYSIPAFRPRPASGGWKAFEDGRVGAGVVAKALNISRGTVHQMCKDGRLDGIWDKARGVWKILLSQDMVAEASGSSLTIRRSRVSEAA